MLWLIIKKELYENLSSYRFYLLTGLLTTLMMISVFVSYRDFVSRMDHYNLTKPDLSSTDAMLPPNPLSVFVKGTDTRMSTLYWVKLTGIESESNQESINKLFSLFTAPDFLFIIKVILSLIALLLSFDAITGEKEDSTLKLIVASGVSRYTFLLGKLIGRFLLVLLPFALLFLCASLAVSLLPDISAGPYFWTRVACVLGISTLYIAVFCSLGVFLSTLVLQSSTSLILNLAVWTFFVFVAPQAGSGIAASFIHVVPAERFEMQQRLADLQAKYERTQREKVSGKGKELNWYYETVHDANRLTIDKFKPRLDELVRLTKSTARISPGGALTLLLSDISNTGVYEEIRLKNALSLYLDRHFEEMSSSRDDIEPFQYAYASISEVFTETGVLDCAVLLTFFFGFTACAFARFKTYDLR